MSDTDSAYIARKDCGCIVAATVDRPEYRADVSREVARWIKHGYTVVHTTVGEAKADPAFLVECDHGKQLSMRAVAHPGEERP